jgi:hypothetical protein
MDSMILILLISEFLIGFVIGLQVINQNDQEIVWKTINRGQDVSLKISRNNILTLFVLTAIGIFSLLIYTIAKKKYPKQ